jgi:hypothetical protein
MSTRLVQLRNGGQRRVALVEEPALRLLNSDSVYSLAELAIRTGSKLAAVATAEATDERLDYDPIYEGSSEWKLLPPIDHPQERARCLISGTGLTHMGSARDRQAMHAKTLTAEEFAELTDSMKMFRSGVDGGRPPAGQIGTPPEWFYKGNGSILRAHGEPLDVPWFAEDGGEEAEIASIFIIGPNGQPFRIGMAIGNEFSDHCFEKKNYLNLAGSKLRTCSIGPELVVDPEFESVAGNLTIRRNGHTIWEKQLRTGEAGMCHSLQNIEHHHFKFDAHRRPGDIHVHFLGADCLSFGESIRLADRDLMQIEFEGFGRALRNHVHVDRAPAQLIRTTFLG